MSESADDILKRLKPTRRRVTATGQAAPGPDEKPAPKGTKPAPKADA